ncbi:cysteine methyltransferase [Hylemonella gracilis str. Niagara R]|uniref:Cysteine methyltransferase n=1 Tax=Hylemonella gracilis str. Niagara R TaxID=1458275 RepID=A0A016XHQ5_9BURK|nr:methylated-DNA--[protein]-cysteine S-methyltransferase [Hylemonella gracilis]EYC51052.1 cysteine methyltransferase [Hylemonella gracilis str. Niagara R]
MQTLAYALFLTPLGHCGLAWSAQGLTGVQLPEADAAATRARMRRRFPGIPEAEPPAAVQAAIAAITALLEGHPGEPRDLTHLPLDMDGVPPFHQRVYAFVRGIPPGETLTYGEVARRLGEPGTARAVGQAMGSNPYAPVVPCHRVLGAGAKGVGFSAHGGTQTKLKMLEMEGARFGGPGLFD